MLRLLRLTFVSFLPGRLLLRGAAVLGVALLIAGGGVFSATHPAKASTSSTCAVAHTVLFPHTATSANTVASYTLLDDGPFVKGLAIQPANCRQEALFVTPDWNHGGTFTGFDNHPIGVWFDTAVGEWAIANEDGAAMPVGAGFNVFIGPPYAISGQQHPTTTSVFVHATTENNSYITYLNDAALNGNPSANLIVTQDANWGGTSAIANPHQIGIWYDSSLGVWTIYNEDGSPIPLGAEFNVMVVQPTIIQSSPDAFTQVATSSNTSGDSTCINNAFSNGQADSFVFVTHIFSGYFTDLPAVWYNASSQESCVFDGSFNTMPVGAQFSVLIL